MATRLKTTLAKQLQRADLALSGLESGGEAALALVDAGYDSNEIAFGRSLYTAATRALAASAGKRGGKVRKTASANAAQEALRNETVSLVTVARATLAADRSTRRALGIDAAVPRPRAALQLYTATILSGLDAAPAPVLARIARRGWTTARRARLADALATLRAEDAGKMEAKGESEQASVAQLDAVAALNAWVMELRKIARIALKDRPQLLESLGIRVS